MTSRTCKTCIHQWPIWVKSVELHRCCLNPSHTKIVESDDTCNDWKEAFDESITGTSFNKD